MSEWQPIEIAPKISQWILGIRPDSVAFVMSWTNIPERLGVRPVTGWLTTCNKIEEPTHWMLLPEFLTRIISNELDK